MPKPATKADLLNSAIRALQKAMPVVSDASLIESAIDALRAELKNTAPRRRRPSLYPLPDHLVEKLREMVKTSGTAATARTIGISTPTVDRILATGQCRLMLAWEIERHFDGGDIIADETPEPDEDVADLDAWELAEARAEVLGLTSHAQIIAAAGSSKPAAILAWATRPLDILGGDQ